MSGYVKLFSEIVDSSIWEQDPETCKVWITMLALANQYGYVRGSIAWLAHKAKVPVNKCQQAVNAFKEPDPISRNPENEGRRITEEGNGWRIINYELFRARDGLSEDPRRVYQREWMKSKRDREKSAPNTSCQHSVNKPVNTCQQSRGVSTSASASAPSVSVPKALGEESVREGGKLSDSERISMERSLERLDARLKELKDADLEPYKTEKRTLKASRTTLLSKLGLPA